MTEHYTIHPGATFHSDQLDQVLQHEAKVAHLERQLAEERRLREQAQQHTSQLAQRAQDAEQAAAARDAERLDRIADAIWDGDGERDEMAELMRDCKRVIWAQVSLADFDEACRFVQYEQAYSECHKAYTNGKRTRDKRQKAVDELAELQRSYDGAEVVEQQIERVEHKIADLDKRLMYWKAHYRAAAAVLAEVVDNMDPAMADSCNRTFIPPDQRASAPKQRAQQRALLAHQREQYLRTRGA